ncbi:MAG: hypothetical protein EOP38_13855 [Rubrivivax sp.]|nr:MAG: hypothetical protein EOP38_13855 [Rubrivivax sp.]
MKRILSLILLAACFAGLPAFAAQEIKGVKFADTYQLNGQTLQLNGAGVRVKFFVDVYVAGLYLPRKEQAAASVLTLPGAKSVQLVLLRNLSGDDFADATEKGFKSNHSDAELAKHQGKLNELLALMRSLGEVKKGTSVHIDFVPGTVKVSINGQVKGEIAAPEDFSQAVLKNWLGNKPVDGDLKKSLLGA